jgi:hypothetical protein
VIRNGLEKGRCPLFNNEQDPVHILLKCSENRKVREHLLSRKWLPVNTEIAYKKIIN